MHYLQEHYAPIRLSVAHLFASLPSSGTVVSVVSPLQGQSLNATTLSSVSHQRLASVHFPERLVGLEDESRAGLGWAFRQVEEQVGLRD